MPWLPRRLCQMVSLCGLLLGEVGKEHTMLSQPRRFFGLSLKIRVHMRKFGQGQNCCRIHKVIRLYVFTEGIFLQNNEFFTVISAKKCSSQ